MPVPFVGVEKGKELATARTTLYPPNPALRRPRHTVSMNSNHEVQVFAKGRLKSELAAFLWTQSEELREHRKRSGIDASHDASFLQTKATLSREVLKLAGRKIPHLELVRCLKDIIGQGKNEEIHLLDPQNMASKISTRISAL